MLPSLNSTNGPKPLLQMPCCGFVGFFDGLSLFAFAYAAQLSNSGGVVVFAWGVGWLDGWWAGERFGSLCVEGEDGLTQKICALPIFRIGNCGELQFVPKSTKWKVGIFGWPKEANKLGVLHIVYHLIYSPPPPRTLLLPMPTAPPLLSTVSFVAKSPNRNYCWPSAAIGNWIRVCVCWRRRPCFRPFALAKVPDCLPTGFLPLTACQGSPTE